MQKIKSLFVIICSSNILFACSSNSSGTVEKKNASLITVNDSSATVKSTIATQVDSNSILQTTVPGRDTSTAIQNNNSDSILSQLKGMASILGKNDSDILKEMGGKNMQSMMQKMQSMMGGKAGNPGNALSKQILNLQLGQMSNDNPIKSVANGMMEAQQNGTAGPSKTHTAVYAEEQPRDYIIPLSGSGNTIELQYTGGSLANGKRDGLWKNIYVNANTANKWNIFTEAYAEQSAINMKAHATSFASLKENYSINTNDQYKKYSRQQRSDVGKNESNVQVQKIAAEKMFGYNCMHVRVTYTIKGLGQVAHLQDDIWYSNEVPGAPFLSPIIFESHSPAVVKKIEDAGCSGVLVKSITTSTGSSQIIQLSKIIKKDMPDSTFILPANYQEDKNTVLYGIQ